MLSAQAPLAISSSREIKVCGRSVRGIHKARNVESISLHFRIFCLTFGQRKKIVPEEISNLYVKENLVFFG